MTIENALAVDAIGINKETGDVHLTISDHLPWGRSHYVLLEAKVNAYLNFAESGEIYTTYPDARGRNLVVHLIAKYRPTPDAEMVFSQISEYLEARGLTFVHNGLPAGYDDDPA